MADYSNFLADLGFGNSDQVPTFQSPDAPQPVAPIAAPQLPVQNSVVPGILAQLQQPDMPQPAAPQMDPAAAPQPGPINAFQAAAPQPPQIDPTQQAPQPNPAPAPVRQRRSLVDIIGHVSDALAQAGGAAPMYQKTLDDRAAKQLAAEDHARAVVSNTLANAHTQQEIDASKAATGKTEAETQNQLQTLAATRYGSALRGLQAIQKANPNADVSQIWPILAKQQGIDDAGSQHLLQVIQQNPNPGTIDGLAAEYEKQSAKGGGGELGLNPFLATDGAGHTKAYQLSKTGDLHEIALPPGFQAATTTSVVDAGDHQIVTDKRTGKVIRTFAKAGAPEKDEAPITDARGNIVAYAPVPGSKLDTKNKATGGVDPFVSYSKARKGLMTLVNSMDDLANDPGLGHATGTTGMLTTHLPSGLGGGDTQRILQKIETLKGKAIPSALNTMRDVSGKLGFRPSQVEVLGDAKGLLGALDNRKTSTVDYVNSLNTNKQLILDQIKALDADAQRNGYVTMQDGKIVPAPKKAAPAPASAPSSLPPRVVLKPNARGAAPTVSNW
jgi:hypothetical protein